MRRHHPNPADILRAFGEANAAQGNYLQWVSLEGQRLTVRFKQPMGVRAEAATLMEVEDAMVLSLDYAVELYLEPRADENKPRQRAEKVQDWIERRGMLKR